MGEKSKQHVYSLAALVYDQCLNINADGAKDKSAWQILISP